MRVRCSFACLVCVILLQAFPAFAHRPYERVAGTFQRADGTAISIVQHYVDGIIAADPVSIQFRLPDGAEVARTPHVFDAIVRPAVSGVEVYQFRTTWLPVASRVESFDGYELKDITLNRHFTSTLVHFSNHWVAYLVTVGLGVLFASLYFALRAMPKRGWRAALRSVGLAFVGVVGSLCAYDILLFEPVSPLVLGVCGAVIFTLVRAVQKKSHATVA